MEHVNSWYAATRARVEYPQLKGDHTADIAVVGGGFTGVSTALFLAERGYDVVIVEANRIGWGASGRNGGQLLDGFVESRRLDQRIGSHAARIAWQMGLECRDIVVSRIRDYGIDCDLAFGYLDLAMTRRELDGLDREMHDKLGKGYPHELRMVSREELPAYIGSDRYVGARYNPGNGHLHPLNLCLGEAAAAARLGARIFERSAVIRLRHGHRPRLETAYGVVNAGRIVLAGDAYLRETEPAIRDLVIPAGSYVIATEQLDEDEAARLLPRNTACCDQRTALDYFRLTPDRRMLFGGLCNYSGRTPRDIAAALRPKLKRVFPSLATARVDYEWGCNIAISINRIPQFGRIGGNTYYAQGYSGHGLAPSHLAGKMLADVIAGDSEQFDLFERVRHWSVPGGRWVANPLLALGMLYFRLKEML